MAGVQFGSAVFCLVNLLRVLSHEGDTMSHVRIYQEASGGVFRASMLSALRITLLVALIFPCPLQAAPGDLDPSFGSGGKVTTGPNSFALVPHPHDRTRERNTAVLIARNAGTPCGLAVPRRHHNLVLLDPLEEHRAYARGLTPYSI